MQIKPSVARAVAARRGVAWQHEDQLFDPTYNVKLGTHYMFELVADFQSVKRAIIAYNYGETAIRGRIQAGKKLPTFYFRRVEKHYHSLRKQFGATVPWAPMSFEDRVG
jgi:soluble lytic murein transglycosylase-like protein